MSRIVFVTDLHLTEGRGGVEAFAADWSEIGGQAPDVVVMGGDVCLWEAGAGDHLQRLLRGAVFPTVCLMGNHDTDREGTRDAFDRDFTQRFGPRNRLLSLADAHVLGLNTCRLQPEYDDWRNVRAEVGAGDLGWLDEALAGLAEDRPLLVFVHIPLVTTYPGRRGADGPTTDVWRVTNADEVVRRLAAWPAPVLVCQGHLHENEHLHREGVHFVSVGSVCGRWWQQGAASRCVDDSPRGWLVIDTEGTDLRLSYHAAGTPGWHGELIPAAGADGGTLLNLFFGDPAQPVEARVRGGWVTLPAPAPVAVDDDFVSVHHWALPDFTGDAVEVRTRMRDQAWDVGLVRRRGAVR